MMRKFSVVCIHAVLTVGEPKNELVGFEVE